MLPFAVSPAQNRIVKFDHFDQHSGLSHTTIYGIYQDSRGFLWVSTQVGLNRFDGYAFKHYLHNPNDPHSLSANSTGPIYEDPWGYLWVGTWGGGLNRLDMKTGQFTAYTHDPADPNSISDNRLHSLAVDQNLNLWIGTFAGGLNRLDLKVFYRDSENDHKPSFKRFVRSDDRSGSLSDNRVWTLAVDLSGKLWIGTNNGLCVMDPAKENIQTFLHDPKNPNSLSDNKIYELHADRTGRLWIATQNGLNLLNPDQKSFQRILRQKGTENTLSDNRIRCLWTDEEGNLWIGTFDGGLNYYQIEKNRWTHYRHDRTNRNSISNDFLRALYGDRSGNLWIATGGEGLDKLDTRKLFIHYQNDPDNNQTLIHNDVTCIYEDRTSKDPALWIGTYGGGLEHLNLISGQWTHYPAKPGRPGFLNVNRIRSVIMDKQGRTWIGTGGGMYMLDAGRKKFIHYENDPANPASISSNRISAIIDNGDETLWVSTEGGGLNLFDIRTGFFKRYLHAHQDTQSLGANYINFILKDRDGNRLWIGTDEGLDLLIISENRFRHFRHNDHDPHSLKSNVIRCIVQDTDGYLWIGTNGGGLSRYDPSNNRFAHFGEVHGLNSNVVYNLLHDGGRYLWMGTGKGLSRFDKTTERFRNYDFSDGLILKGFYEKSCHPLRSSWGDMFFGGINGFTRFHPDRITNNPNIPRIVLTAFKKLNADVFFDRDINVMDTILLRYSDRNFSFEFSALDFSNVNKNQYAYKLSGFDKDWIVSGPRRYVSYTNLDGGEYNLQIKGSNNDAIWNEEGIRVLVQIEPPFWQIWWFKLIAAAGFLGIIWGVYQIRIRRIEQQKRKLSDLIEERTAELRQKNIELEILNEKKNEFLGIAAHDLRNPMGAIIGFLDLMHQDMKSGRLNIQEAIDDLAMVLNSARQMVQLITELLDISAIESGKITLDMHAHNLNSLIEDCERIHRKTAAQKNIRLIIQRNDTLPALVMDKNRISEVIDNLLSNAIKYTHPSGEVRLYTEMGPGEVRVHVQDSGQGLDENDMQQVFRSFRKLSAKPTGGESSTGFGLAIVKKLVELHRGQVWVESQPGHGSTFSFSIPVSGKSA